MNIKNYTQIEVNEICDKNRKISEELFGSDAIPQYKDFKCQKIKKGTVVADYNVFPFIYSPSFHEQYSVQIGNEIISKSRLREICDNVNYYIRSTPFFYSAMMNNCGETSYYDEKKKCYYFASGWNFCGITVNPLNISAEIPQRIIYTHPIASKDGKSQTFIAVLKGWNPKTPVSFVYGLFWVKCSSESFVGDKTDFYGKFDKNNIKFEIIDHVPDKFPEYENLSEELRKKASDFVSGMTGFYQSFFDRVYKPNIWKKEIKACRDVLNKKVEAKKNVKMKSVFGKKEKFPIETPDDCFGYPNLNFSVYLKENTAQEASVIIEAAIAELNDKLCKRDDCGFEMIQVDVKSENNVDLFIDFGDTDEEEYFTVLDTLSKLGLGIEKIIVD